MKPESGFKRITAEDIENNKKSVIKELYGDQEVHNIDGLLSNMAATPFILDGEQLPSMEAFIQMIKYPPDDPRRKDFYHIEAHKAKFKVKKQNKKIFNQLDSQVLPENSEQAFVFWKEKAIPYRSTEHLQLIKKALTAKFDQNQNAKQALIATGKKRLVHVTGFEHVRQTRDGLLENPYTSLPADNLVGILTEIRSKYQEESRQ